MPFPEIDQLLLRTEAFIKTMHVVEKPLPFATHKQHLTTCIKYADLQEMRPEFIREMMNTVNAFVYSKKRQEELVEIFVSEGRDAGAAWSELGRRAHKKFRRDDLKGQFSELLLCNLLQHHFKAVPLLRKMSLTTNPKLERNGADAIHVAEVSGNPLLYIGEAKTYHRESNSFRDAVTHATLGVLEHYHKHRGELDLYTYEDFLTPELEEFARQYRAGEISDAQVHLVCIATYNCPRPIANTSQEEILKSIIDNTLIDASCIKQNSAFTSIPAGLRPRMNYIIFSVRELNALIEVFEKSFSHAP